MGTFALTGKDTLTIFDRNIVDTSDADLTTVSFPNELVTVKTGKNNNTIYAENATGKNCDVTIRVIRGSSDDKFLQSKISEQLRDFPAFVTAKGTFVKRIGDGSGGITNDTYNLEGGVFVKPVDGKENAEGDTEAGVAIYTMKFALGTRSHS